MTPCAKRGGGGLPSVVSLNVLSRLGGHVQAGRAWQGARVLR